MGARLPLSPDAKPARWTDGLDLLAHQSADQDRKLFEEPDACYVGKSGDCYTWVGPDGIDALTEFTLTALKISSLIKERETLISPGSVKFSPADREG